MALMPCAPSWLVPSLVPRAARLSGQASSARSTRRVSMPGHVFGGTIDRQVHYI